MSSNEALSGYKAEISRANPGCFLFLIDQSTSMNDSMAEGGSKKQNVADAINKLLANLVIKCAREEGVRSYFDIGVIGYGSTVDSAFGGALAGETLVSISKIADLPLKVEERQQKVPDGAGGIITQSVKFPIWFEPQASGSTPMKEAFQMAYAWLSEWVHQHPDAYPPVVINITDGEASDPINEARAVASLATSDGNVLVFNIHISPVPANPITFPSSSEGLPDRYSSLLYDMSSLLPASLRRAASNIGYSVDDRTRGFVFNADLVKLIEFLEIGTRIDKMSDR